MFIANGQDTEEITNMINLAHSALSLRMRSYHWSRREISTTLFGSETWPERAAGERMLVDFDSNTIRRILSYKYTGTVRAKKAPLV